MTEKIDVIDVMDLGNTQLTKSNKKQEPLRVHHFFTYNNYSKDEIDVIDVTLQHFCYMFAFQEEIGENGTPHLQGVISCKKQMRNSSLGLPKQIHWEKCVNVGLAYKYCTKDKSRNGRRIVYNYAPIKEIKLIEPDRAYQKFIINIIDKEPDDRKIYWFYEEVGGVGKSSFCKWLVVKKDALYIDEGKKSDIVNLLFKADMNKHNLIVLDIPRANGNKCSYKTLESIKNGVICNTKYETGTKVFNCPHLIVFSNFFPEMEGLSKDRLQIYYIDNTYGIVATHSGEDVANSV